MSAATPAKKTNSASDPAPWVPGAVARRTVGLLTLVTLILSGVIVCLGIVAVKLAKNPPKLVVNQEGKYTSAELQEIKVSRDDVELYVQLVIPRLYAQSGGVAPGLEQIRHMVNANIITEQLEQTQKRANNLEKQGVTQFAIVNGVNPNTLVINHEKKTVYVEAIGLIGLTDKEGKARTVQTQWQMLMYLVDIIPTGKNTPGTNTAIGNERGLYLQQYREQKPGTINDNDAPKVQASDLQEWETQRKAKQERENLIRQTRDLNISTEQAPAK